MRKGAKIYIILVATVCVFLVLLQHGKIQEWILDVKGVAGTATNLVNQGVEMTDNNLNERMDQMTRREHCTEYLQVVFMNTGDTPCAVVYEPESTLIYGVPKSENLNVLTQELLAHKVTSVDMVVIPRLISEEVDSLNILKSNTDIKKVVIPDMEIDTGTKQSIIDDFGEDNTICTKSGDEIDHGKAIYTVLAGNSDVAEDNSLILQVWNAAESYLFAGWATTAEMEAFVQSSPATENVIQMPNETTVNGGVDIGDWIKKLGKSSGYVFQCDTKANGSGLHDDLYRVLRKNEITYYRTDLQGVIRCIGNSSQASFLINPAMKYHLGD